MLLQQSDMPFSMQTGITPDLIINPLCIPSRMTVNQLMEMTKSKSCCLKYEFGDASPFSESSTNAVEDICNELGSLGYERFGKEKLINGMTGDMIEADIFVGPAYYQRLRHMVIEMMHAKGTGEPDEEVLGDAVAFAGVAKFPARIKCALLGWMALQDAEIQSGLLTNQFEEHSP